MFRLVIIQPWFSAVGHPAQSLINTARIIGRNNDILYLISEVPGLGNVKFAKEKLQESGDVIEYPVQTDSVREGTLKGLSSLKKLLSAESSIDRIFFLDAHLVLLAALWPFYCRPNIRALSVVYLFGPERVSRFWPVKWMLQRFLKRREVQLLLRTEELVSAWREAFLGVNVKCLPSLELPEDDFDDAQYAQTPSAHIRFGVLGQIRTGKSLEWLVPLFKSDATLGKLTVAGTFNNDAERQSLSGLVGFEGFRDKFLTEDELVKYALAQDYLLMLYDHWDHRMEGAMMFLAARVNRPVIVFDKGWCGRMVHTYGNGVLAPENSQDFPQFAKALPGSGSPEYLKLLQGVASFKAAHSGAAVRSAFLEIIQA